MFPREAGSKKRGYEIEVCICRVALRYAQLDPICHVVLYIYIYLRNRNQEAYLMNELVCFPASFFFHVKFLVEDVTSETENQVLSSSSISA